MKFQHFTVARIIGAILAVAIVAAFVALSARAGHSGGMERMALDMDSGAAPGNTATSLGTTEFCARINENDFLDADEDQVDALLVDTVARDIPASAPIAGYYYLLNYNETGLTVQAHNPNFLLGSRPGSSVGDASGGVPDNDGDGTWGGSAIDLTSGTSEVGSGVLDRLTIVSDPGADPGVRLLTLSDASHFDEAGVNYGPHQMDNAWAAVDTPCPSDPPAPTTPTPSPSPSPSTRPSVTPPPPPPPTGAVIRVPADYPSIQAAIDAASNGDRVLVAPGTYRENLVVAGKSLELVSEAGPASTIIDGAGLGEVVAFRAGSFASLIQGFTVVNGRSVHGGGGIDVHAAGASIIGNWLMNNRACGQGAVLARGYSVVLIQSNVIRNNRTTEGCSGGSGGGISISFSSGDIINNTIEGNAADSGGGISLFVAYRAQIQGNVFSNNSSLFDGGAIWAVNDRGRGRHSSKSVQGKP